MTPTRDGGVALSASVVLPAPIVRLAPFTMRYRAGFAEVSVERSRTARRAIPTNDGLTSFPLTSGCKNFAETCPVSLSAAASAFQGQERHCAVLIRSWLKTVRLFVSAKCLTVTVRSRAMSVVVDSKPGAFVIVVVATKMSGLVVFTPSSVK